jgi:prepilin-type N-terminal cleavage/methylation domain-containing protein
VARVRADGAESGFTLIELVVAMLVMLIMLTATLGFFVSSLKTVTLAKQRQTATALATQVLEQIRALPYDQVAKGIDSNDIVLAGVNADPHLTSATTFTPTTGGITETLR